jgi:hypothetical protein
MNVATEGWLSCCSQLLMSPLEHLTPRYFKCIKLPLSYCGPATGNGDAEHPLFAIISRSSPFVHLIPFYIIYGPMATGDNPAISAVDPE